MKQEIKLYFIITETFQIEKDGGLPIHPNSANKLKNGMINLSSKVLQSKSRTHLLVPAYYLLFF